MKTKQTPIKEIFILIWKDLRKEKSHHKIIGIIQDVEQVQQTMQKHCKHKGNDDFMLFGGKVGEYMGWFEDFPPKPENYASQSALAKI